MGLVPGEGVPCHEIEYLDLRLMEQCVVEGPGPELGIYRTPHRTRDVHLFTYQRIG